MEENEPPNPAYVGLFGPQAEMPHTGNRANFIEELRL